VQSNKKKETTGVQSNKKKETKRPLISARREPPFSMAGPAEGQPKTQPIGLAVIGAGIFAQSAWAPTLR
jgi:hypothetical protein